MILAKMIAVLLSSISIITMGIPFLALVTINIMLIYFMRVLSFILDYLDYHISDQMNFIAKTFNVNLSDYYEDEDKEKDDEK